MLAQLPDDNNDRQLLVAVPRDEDLIAFVRNDMHAEFLRSVALREGRWLAEETEMKVG